MKEKIQQRIALLEAGLQQDQRQMVFYTAKLQQTQENIQSKNGGLAELRELLAEFLSHPTDNSVSHLNGATPPSEQSAEVRNA